MNFLDTLYIKAICYVGTMQPLHLTSTFNEIKEGLDTNVADTGALGETIDTAGATVFSITQKVGLYIALIVCALTGIGFLLSSGADRQDKKTGLVYKVVGILLLVGAVGIVGFLIAGTTGLLDSATATVS